MRCDAMAFGPKTGKVKGMNERWPGAAGGPRRSDRYYKNGIPAMARDWRAVGITGSASRRSSGVSSPRRMRPVPLSSICANVVGSWRARARCASVGRGGGVVSNGRAKNRNPKIPNCFGQERRKRFKTDGRTCVLRAGGERRRRERRDLAAARCQDTQRGFGTGVDGGGRRSLGEDLDVRRDRSGVAGDAGRWCVVATGRRLGFRSCERRGVA